MKKLLLTATLALSLASLAAPFISYAQYSSYQDCISQGGLPEDCATVFPNQAPSPTLNSGVPTGGRDQGNTNVNTSLPNPIPGGGNLITLLDSIANFLLTASVLIATIIVIYAAFQIVTSGGDPGKVETGKKTIVYAVIGLGIMLLAKVIIAIVKQVLGVQF